MISMCQWHCAVMVADLREMAQVAADLAFVPVLAERHADVDGTLFAVASNPPVS